MIANRYAVLAWDLILQIEYTTEKASYFIVNLGFGSEQE